MLSKYILLIAVATFICYSARPMTYKSTWRSASIAIGAAVYATDDVSLSSVLDSCFTTSDVGGSSVIDPYPTTRDDEKTFASPGPTCRAHALFYLCTVTAYADAFFRGIVELKERFSRRRRQAESTNGPKRVQSYSTLPFEE